MATTYGVYIHIPFCKSKCDYCDFYSLAGREEEMDHYQKALIAQLRSFAPRLKGRVADTIYFGGGTPSYYGEKRLRELLMLIQRVFTVSRQAEITVECNPDSVDWRSIARLRRAGVNRISLGAQTADPQQLRCLHRIPSTRQVVQAVADIRRAKITNLSLDLIYGLPDQDMASWLDTLNKAIALAPEHLSCYGLKVEEGTPLARQAELGLELPDGDDQADFYLAAVDRLRQAGYHQYEISNFSKPGKESRHNLKYWMGREYVGFGPGAHSYFDGQRYAYPRDLAGYLAAGGLVAPVDVQPIPPTAGAGVPAPADADPLGHRGVGVPPQLRPELRADRPQAGVFRAPPVDRPDRPPLALHSPGLPALQHPHPGPAGRPVRHFPGAEVLEDPAGEAGRSQKVIIFRFSKDQS